jgi:hypothetical protein
MSEPTPYAGEAEYRDDLDSLLAQLRDVEQALHSIRTNLVPLVTGTRPGETMSTIERQPVRRALVNPDTADAWAHPYHADQVTKLARAAANAARDAALIQQRYAATDRAELA